MNEVDFFLYLGKKKKAEILELLENAYFEMNSDQRQSVFGSLVSRKIKETNLKKIDVDEIYEDIVNFQKESMSGYYYAPFNINSKNYMDIPEETSEWCNEISTYLDQTSQLSIQRFHEVSIKCFQILFGLIDDLGEKEIIFADEIGSWMVGADEEQAFKCYITSLAEYCSPADFVKNLIPLLKRDYYESFSNKIFQKALSGGNGDQAALLKSEIKRLNIKVD
jgi:hypothetical protein